MNDGDAEQLVDTCRDTAPAGQSISLDACGTVTAYLLDRCRSNLPGQFDVGNVRALRRLACVTLAAIQWASRRSRGRKSTPLVENAADAPSDGTLPSRTQEMLDPDRVTYADFIAYAESHVGKFEFVDGQIISQAKPTKRHQRLSLALGNLLTSHVEPQGCDVLLDTTLELSDVRDDERAPDLMVTCDSADLSDDESRRVRRPTLVIEILSESTAADDLGTKLLDYQAIPSIREYLVIDSRKRWAVLYIRDAQQLFVAPRDYIAGRITLASIGYELNLDALYERARIATRLPASPD